MLPRPGVQGRGENTGPAASAWPPHASPSPAQGSNGYDSRPHSGVRTALGVNSHKAPPCAPPPRLIRVRMGLPGLQVITHFSGLKTLRRSAAGDGGGGGGEGGFPPVFGPQDPPTQHHCLCNLSCHTCLHGAVSGSTASQCWVLEVSPESKIVIILGPSETKAGPRDGHFRTIARTVAGLCQLPAVLKYPE